MARAILWLHHVLIQKQDVKSNVTDTCTCATSMAAPRVNYTMCTPSYYRETLASYSGHSQLFNVAR